METLLQRSRYELKYMVSEACAREVRDFARHYLAPDPFADPDRGFAYPIYSVYLDNPKLDLFQATIQGHKNRFKLRMRFYAGNPDAPVYFEIKRRANGAILKERAKVHREFATGLLTGDCWPERSHLVSEFDSHAYAALRRFCELREKLGAKPRVIVCYTREAWLTPDNNSARLTFDRDLYGGPYHPALSVVPTEEWVAPPLSGVILELKFTDRCPNWMREMIRVFNLQRCSMAKYVKCVHSMQPWRRAEARVPARLYPGGVAPAPAAVTAGPALPIAPGASAAPAAPASAGASPTATATAAAVAAAAGAVLLPAALAQVARPAARPAPTSVTAPGVASSIA